MAKFENKMNINAIKFQATTRNFCPLGQDMYTNHFMVAFEPTKFIPDYDEVEQKINDFVDGDDMSIEEAVSAVFDIIEEYNPLYLSVTSSVDDAGHFPVEVTKVKE